MANRVELAKKLAAVSDERLTQLEERLEGLAAQVRELAARVNRSTPDANVQKALQAAQKAAQDTARLTSVTRSLEAKCEALSRAVGEMKAKLAHHRKLLDNHHEGLVARTEDDKVFNERIGKLYRRVKLLEEGLDEVAKWSLQVDHSISRSVDTPSHELDIQGELVTPEEYKWTITGKAVNNSDQDLTMVLVVAGLRETATGKLVGLTYKLKPGEFPAGSSIPYDLKISPDLSLDPAKLESFVIVRAR